MSVMFVMGPCICCGRIFSFNPDLVPSIYVKDVREPVCAECMAAANAFRIARGEQPHAILDGAYEPQEID